MNRSYSGARHHLKSLHSLDSKQVLHAFEQTTTVVHVSTIVALDVALA